MVEPEPGVRHLRQPDPKPTLQQKERVLVHRPLRNFFSAPQLEQHQDFQQLFRLLAEVAAQQLVPPHLKVLQHQPRQRELVPPPLAAPLVAPLVQRLKDPQRPTVEVPEDAEQPVAAPLVDALRDPPVAELPAPLLVLRAVQELGERLAQLALLRGVPHRLLLLGAHPRRERLLKLLQQRRQELPLA